LSSSKEESRKKVSAAVERARKAKEKLFVFGYDNKNKEDFQEAVVAINDLLNIAKNGNK
jgi:hypothetical protein